MYDRPKTSSCSLLDMSRRQLQFMFSGKTYFLTTPSNSGQLDGRCLELSFTGRVVVYIIILGIIVIVVFLILKFLSHCDAEASTERLHVAAVEDVSETSPLSDRPFAVTYRTVVGDEETASSSSSEDVYNAKLCVICYEEQRNCFFVPCGHSATCRGCARKIMAAEAKVCPICRRVIRKSRRLLFRL